MMRDLEKDLEICEAATKGPIIITVCDNGQGERTYLSLTYADCSLDLPDARFIAEAREGWPEAIRRAIAAEEKVDRLQHEIRMVQDCRQGVDL